MYWHKNYFLLRFWNIIRKGELQIEKKYVRAKGVAEHFKIGLSTVWLYKKQGKIKSFKLSKKVTLFDIKEVEKDLLKNKLR